MRYLQFLGWSLTTSCLSYQIRNIITVNKKSDVSHKISSRFLLLEAVYTLEKTLRHLLGFLYFQNVKFCREILLLRGFGYLLLSGDMCINRKVHPRKGSYSNGKVLLFKNFLDNGYTSAFRTYVDATHNFSQGIPVHCGRVYLLCTQNIN